MAKFDMSGIPEANIPYGYELRILRPDEKSKWDELCTKAFNEKNTYQDRIENVTTFAEKHVFGIFCADELAATGTALCDYKDGKPVGYGCVHMIAAYPEHSGKKLGYEVVAAVLRRMRDCGFEKAELTTDDFRLPAIKIYRSLGFAPDLNVDETMRERWENIYKIFGWELS
jgi:mycothiol synthase